MKIIKNILVLFMFAFSFWVDAQNTNIFLDRDYWKTNPSIEDIDTKIKEGNDISALNEFSFDGLSWALIEKASNKTIKYLLTKEGNGVNKKTHDGRTYIFWAAYKDNLEMMEYLVSKGAKTDLIDDHGYSLLNFAAVTGQVNTKLYDLCIGYGANVLTEKNNDGANPLLLVSPYAKDFEILDYFISKGLDLHSVDNLGNGIFNFASRNGNIELLNMLIEKKVDYKSLNKEGGNAMIFASRGTRGNTNSLTFYKYLEKLGIAPNVVTNKGVNALHSIAYRSKDVETVDYFIDKGVDVNQQNEEGNTPFLLASYSNDLSIISHISKHVNDYKIKNKDGKSALTFAVQRNSVEVVEFLINKGTDVSVLDAKGNNLGYYLVNYYSSETPEVFEQKLSLLQEKGLDITKAQGNGNTLYHVALEKNNLDLLKRIHSLGIDVNVKNDEGITPLQKAAMKAKNEEILKYLISIGADKNVKTAFDESVFDLASENELLKKNQINISFLR